MFTAKEIMDDTAALLNDVALTNFTYVAQLPFLNIAIHELNSLMALNNVPFTNAVEESVRVNAGITSIGGGGSAPVLPTGLVEIRDLYERTYDSSEDFILMTRREFIPNTSITTQALIFWAWIGNVIKFIGATSDREVRIQYIKNRIPRALNEGAVITEDNARQALFYRTAGLCARFIGENDARADQLDADAQIQMDVFLGIEAKAKQGMPVRRRPFRSGYKSVNFGY